MLTQNNDGTHISFTRFVHYGKFTAMSAQVFIFIPYDPPIYLTQ